MSTAIATYRDWDFSTQMRCWSQMGSASQSESRLRKQQSTNA